MREWPQPPSRIAIPAAVYQAASLAAIAGGAALAWAFWRGEAVLAWSAYLIGAFLVIGLGVFGAAWLAILQLAGATWAVTMRRIPEAMTAWLIPGSVLLIGVGLGSRELYLWAHPDPGDELLAHKAAFLNPTMFVSLVTISLIAWVAFAWLMVRASHRQDAEGGMKATATNRVVSAVFLVVFALSLSVVSFYFLMSLDAHWFSTMFAVLVFTDVIQTGTAFVAIVAGLLVAGGALKDFVREDHLHSLGKMVFASTGFWAYIYFCQFMLIWYANIPEETAYFIRRSENGWLAYLLLLPFLKFAVPFLLLVPRSAKRSPRALVPIAALIVFAQFWELYVMVAPALGHGAGAAHAHFPLVELAVAAGFMGVFILVFANALTRHAAVPIKDPALAACLAYHS
jgi:hypothetical protein